MDSIAMEASTAMELRLTLIIILNMLVHLLVARNPGISMYKDKEKTMKA